MWFAKVLSLDRVQLAAAGPRAARLFVVQVPVPWLIVVRNEWQRNVSAAHCQFLVRVVLFLLLTYIPLSSPSAAERRAQVGFYSKEAFWGEA